MKEEVEFTYEELQFINCMYKFISDGPVMFEPIENRIDMDEEEFEQVRESVRKKIMQY